MSTQSPETQLLSLGPADSPLHGGEDRLVSLLAMGCFDIVRETRALYTLHRVLKIAPGMELRGMVHRNIPPCLQIIAQPWFYELFRACSKRAIIRTLLGAIARHSPGVRSRQMLRLTAPYAGPCHLAVIISGTLVADAL